MRSAYLLAPILLFLAGCSNHPLVQDMTGYTTDRIVDKLRCEARTAIENRLTKKTLWTYHAAVLKLKYNLKEYNDWRARNGTMLAEFDKKFDAHNARGKANQEKLDNLTALGKQLVGEWEGLEGEISRTANEDTRTRLNARLQRIVERVAVARSKSAPLKTAQQEIKQEAIKIQNDYRDHFNRIGAMPERYLKIKKTMEERDKTLKSPDPHPSLIGDEFSDEHAASFRELFVISRTTLSMKLDFTIVENNNATIADGLLMWPISLGAVSLNFKASRTKQRDAQRVVHVTSTFEELTNPKLLQCSDDSLLSPTKGLVPIRLSVTWVLMTLLSSTSQSSKRGRRLRRPRKTPSLMIFHSRPRSQDS